jgi:hypothetical protein
MKRTLAPEGLLALDIIADARLAPDGRRVAYAVKRARPEHNDYPSAIYLTSTLRAPANDRPAEQQFTGDEEATARAGAPIRRLTGLRYRFNDVGYIDGRYQQLR